MARISMTGSGIPSEINDYLTQGILDSGLSCELLDRVQRGGGDQFMTVSVFEKYYWRSSNRASLTPVVCGAGGRVYVDAIGSGGGQGPLFKFSWGAEESFVSVVENLLCDRDFR